MSLPVTQTVFNENFAPSFQNLFKVYIIFDTTNNSDLISTLGFNNLPSNLKETTTNNIVLHLLDQTSITLPDISVETLEIPNVSFNLKQQSSITFGEEVTVSVVEQSTFLYRDIFEKWIKLVYDYESYGYIIPKKYKQKSLVVEHVQKWYTGSNTTNTFTIGIYRFVNQYPTSIQGNDLDYSTTELLNRDIVFRYDYLEEVINNLKLPHLVAI